MCKAALELWSNALQIVWQQLKYEIPWCFFWCPRAIVLFVCSKQDALSLLAGINFSREVDHVRKFATGFFVVCDYFFHWFGHQVVVFHRQHWQFNSAHAAHFARPQTTSVHYMLCVNGVVFVGNDVPCSVCALAEAGHPRLGVHLGSAVTSTNCVSVCYAVWVYRAFVFVVQRTYEVLLFKQGVEFFCFFHRQHFHVHAQVTTAGLRHLQPVETLWCIGKLQAARQVNAAILA